MRQRRSATLPASTLCAALCCTCCAAPAARGGRLGSIPCCPCLQSRLCASHPLPLPSLLTGTYEPLSRPCQRAPLLCACPAPHFVLHHPRCAAGRGASVRVSVLDDPAALLSCVAWGRSCCVNWPGGAPVWWRPGLVTLTTCRTCCSTLTIPECMLRASASLSHLRSPIPCSYGRAYWRGRADQELP